MMPSKVNFWLKSMATSLLFPASTVLAADGQSSTSYDWAPFWLALAIAYLTRRRRIGGWLFYYYFQLYGSIVFLVFILVFSLRNYEPSTWHDKELYTLLIISTVPFYLLKLFETIAATLLLVKSYRSQKFINYLKCVLILEVIIEILSFFIDDFDFANHIFFDVLGGIFAAIWYLYFKDSLRAYYVLANPDWEWNYDNFKKAKSQGKKVNKAL